MSVYATMFVWETSKQKSTALLALLALADYADEETGEAFPGITKLTKKLRMKERNVQTLMRKLEETGEIVIAENKGQQTPSGRTNRYTLVGYVAWYKEVQKIASLKSKGVQDSVKRGAKNGNQGVQEVAPKPLVEPPMRTVRQPDAIYDAISQVWKTTAGAIIGNMKAMMLGTAKNGDWAAANFDVPATADEIISFGQWYKRKNPDLTIPNKPEKIQRWFYEYRQAAAKRITQLDPVNDLSIPVDFEPILTAHLKAASNE